MDALLSPANRCIQEEEEEEVEAAAFQFKEVVEQLLRDAKEESVGSVLEALASMLVEKKQVPSHTRWPGDRVAKPRWAGGAGAQLGERAGMQVVAALAHPEHCEAFPVECRECVTQALQLGPAREQFTFLMELVSDHVTGEEEWSRPLVAILLWGLAAVLPRIARRLDAFVAECAPLLTRLAEQDPRGPVPSALVGVAEAIATEWGREGGHASERMGDGLSALSLRILGCVGTIDSCLHPLVGILERCGHGLHDLLGGSHTLLLTRLNQQEGGEEDPSREAAVLRGAAVAVAWAVREGKGAAAVASEALAVLRMSEEAMGHPSGLEAGLELLEAVAGKHPPLPPEHLTALTLSLMRRTEEGRSGPVGQRCWRALQEVVRGGHDPQGRLVALTALVDEARHPVMVALLLGFAKEEAQRCWGGAEEAFVSHPLLQLVGRVVRPQGDLPDLPHQSEAVLAALNLYRFLLLREAAAGRSATGCLTAEMRAVGREHWLLPLRPAAHAALEMVRSGREGGAVLMTTLTVESVLYRCLEIVEGEG